MTRRHPQPPKPVPFRYLLDATAKRDALSSEEDDQAIGQILHLQKDVNGMGAVRRGSRDADWATAIAAAPSQWARTRREPLRRPRWRPLGREGDAGSKDRFGRRFNARGLDRAERHPVRGLIGAAVKSVQRRLAALKYDPGTSTATLVPTPKTRSGRSRRSTASR